MSDPINANPVVLSEADLPTRANAASRKKTEIVEDAGLSSLKTSPSYIYSLFQCAESPESDRESSDGEEEYEEPIDAQEIYDLISTITDPEHPISLGQLAVVNLPHIYVKDSGDKTKMAEVLVEITPTITHCSLATLIGLGIRVRLERCLPPRFRITINVRKGTHQSETQVNKQLNDKERVAAACENEQLLKVISEMFANCK
ncbi:MIP18 family protein YHR122W [Trichomonascus vanleenenianus]|uniref:iron-sulfur cluster assembly protein CIA2 n=1 Tax=Trichomonascus vanleenenianus TaxID=2268995 RepID=UPI003EC96FD8